SIFCRMLFLGEKIVFLTPDVRNKFIEKNSWCTPNKVIVIPNACKFNLRDKSFMYNNVENNIDNVDILFSGRLAKGKNILFIIDVYCCYRDLGGRGKLNIAGDGELYSKVKDRICASKYSDDIYMLGYVENMSDVYLNSHTLILASDFEGFPMAILEAIYHGLHIVSSNCESGPAFIFEPNEDIQLLSHYSNKLGFLLPLPDKYNIDDYALALLALESKPRNSKAITNKALSYFCEDNIFAMWMNLFKSDGIDC
ncbi:MAG: glycosyltransferase, partial [Aeromonas sp.]